MNDSRFTLSKTTTALAFGAPLLDPDTQQPRSVYWVDSPYVTQIARLVGDFTREFVQPLFAVALSQVGRRTLRAQRAVFVATRDDT